MIGLISWIIVGAIGGWLAGYVLHQNTALNIADIVLGMIGAVIGGWIGGMFIPNGGDLNTFSILGILAAFVGAVIVAFIYEKVTGKTAQ